jgi:hypothetical protein
MDSSEKTEEGLTRSREGREEEGESTRLNVKELSAVVVDFAASRLRVNQIGAR